MQARLTEALQTRRIVLLCAPAGYGKTTLLAQAVARMPPSSGLAWVAADPGDDLPRHDKFRPNTRGLEGTEPPDDSSLTGGSG